MIELSTLGYPSLTIANVGSLLEHWTRRANENVHDSMGTSFTGLVELDQYSVLRLQDFFRNFSSIRSVVLEDISNQQVIRRLFVGILAVFNVTRFELNNVHVEEDPALLFLLVWRKSVSSLSDVCLRNLVVEPDVLKQWASLAASLGKHGKVLKRLHLVNVRFTNAERCFRYLHEVLLYSHAMVDLQLVNLQQGQPLPHIVRTPDTVGVHPIGSSTTFHRIRSDEATRLYSAISKLANLKTLVLKDLPITSSDAAQALIAQAQFLCLERLCLIDCSLGPLTVAALVQKRFPYLRVLDITQVETLGTSCLRQLQCVYDRRRCRIVHDRPFFAIQSDQYTSLLGSLHPASSDSSHNSDDDSALWDTSHHVIL
jgi:hypothetical protein